MRGKKKRNFWHEKYIADNELRMQNEIYPSQKTIEILRTGTLNRLEAKFYPGKNFFSAYRAYVDSIVSIRSIWKSGEDSFRYHAEKGK